VPASGLDQTPKPAKCEPRQGARAVAGGKALERPGYFVEPTLHVGTKPDMIILREEIFGPVLAAAPFDDLHALARETNDSPYGLGAGIWTKDIAKAHKAGEAAEGRDGVRELLQRLPRRDAIWWLQGVRLGT
jgi:acyl-CoA reductase-like NAD-dependent aldehyde dehydrogenase